MTEKQFNEIKERLAKWRKDRHLTYKNQQAGFLGNVFEEVSEYFRAKDNLERIDALCDIVIFSLNSFNIEYEEIYEDLDFCLLPTNTLIANILTELRFASYFYLHNHLKKSKSYISEMLANINLLVERLGFDFYKCMIQTIKEIESRTGYYDENLNKFIKDTSDEAKAKWYKADYESCRIK